MKQWLTDAGLNVDSVGADNHYIAVSGTTDAINTAFGTQLANVRHPGADDAGADDRPVRSGHTLDVVLAVTGLTTFGHKVKPSRLRRAGRVRQLDAVLELLRPAARVERCRSSRARRFRSPCAATRRASSAPPTASAAAASSTGPRAGVRPSRSSTRTTPRRCERDADIYSIRHGDRPFSGRQFARPERSRGSHDRGRLRRQRLVRRAGARRRGRARDGAGCERRLLRRGAAATTTTCWPRWRRSSPTTTPRSSRTRGASRRSSSIRRLRSTSTDRPDRDRRLRLGVQAGRSPGDRLLLLVG